MLTMVSTGYNLGILAQTIEEAEQKRNDRNKRQRNIQSPSPVFMPMDEKNIMAPRHVELRVESCAHNPSTKTRATDTGPRF